MKDLLEALTILWKYITGYNEKYPLHCEHDVLFVCGIDFSIMDYKTMKKLIDFGFIPGNADDDCNTVVAMLGENFDWNNMTKEEWKKVSSSITDCMHSYRYGSC